MTNKRAQLDAEVVALCSVRPPLGVADGVGVKRAAELLDTHMQTGGKRLRGLLPMLVVEAEGGDAVAARRFGAAVEAIHNGTLVHDDIQDRDTLRRGLPTLWTQVGVPQAINIGDIMLIAPVAGLLADSAFPDALARGLAGALSGALVETIRGQVADVNLRDKAGVTLEELSAIACAKTSPLFAAALQGSCMILGKSQSQIDAAGTCGHRLGLAFQVRDDLLDALGTKGRGNAGSDLREGKPTWPLLAAAAGADEAELEPLKQLLRDAAAGTPPADEDVLKWVQWTHDRGGVDKAREALGEALAEARELATRAFDGGESVVADLCDRLARLDG